MPVERNAQLIAGVTERSHRWVASLLPEAAVRLVEDSLNLIRALLLEVQPAGTDW
ncbi:hypothetical protein ABZ070_36935 [Streptomyces sp. NPDC006283]|uniref:hypothetical protein n=1 Tax=Streptomyces sp. NPDC006283 TaxID=3156741 RepID=UPI0033A75811